MMCRHQHIQFGPSGCLQRFYYQDTHSTSDCFLHRILQYHTSRKPFAYGISLANFFAENDMVEITPETKSVLDNWNYLTKEEKDSIKLVIDNYINRKR